MKKLLLLFFAIQLLGSCYKERYEEKLDELNQVQMQLDMTRSELVSATQALQLSQREVESLRDELNRLRIDFRGATASQREQVMTNVTNDIISVMVDAYREGFGIISVEDFNLTFINSNNSLYAMGEFCREDIPIEVNINRYLTLSPLYRLQLIYHEFGHSYFNYLHPQNRTFINAPVFDETERIEVMDATRWIDDIDHLSWALDRFWNAEGQYVLPCDGTTPAGKFKCKIL